jgi:hypothetical protein
MLAITTTSERTGHWTKMRRSLARFSGPELLVHTPSLADFITTTSEFRFSVHTGVQNDSAPCRALQIAFPPTYNSCRSKGVPSGLAS